MIYQFKCTTPDCMMYDDTFKVEQPMMDEHFAYCHVCGFQAQRIYTPLPFQFGKADYNKDGSRDLNPDLPDVPSGTKYTHGFGKGKK